MVEDDPDMVRNQVVEVINETDLDVDIVNMAVAISKEGDVLKEISTSVNMVGIRKVIVERNKDEMVVVKYLVEADKATKDNRAVAI